MRSDRIDVFAQKALLRMSKNPAMSADANEMAAAVKSGSLGGIYKEDEKVPALRARKMNSSWWLIIPKGEDAVLFLDPEKPKTGVPIIVFRDSVRSLPHRLDPALFKAWQTYKIWKQTTQGRTYPVRQCGTITPNGVVMAKAFSGKPLSNLTPSILCQVGGATNGTPCICTVQRSVCPCPDGMCKIPDSCNLKCPQKPSVKCLSFQEMWDLIIRHYYCELPTECNPSSKSSNCPSSKELLEIFSPELLIAIFWEETGFRNIPQLLAKGCGPAVGFGQVQGATREKGNKISSIFLACDFCGTKPVWEPQEILCDDAKAVKITGMLLWRLYCLTGKNKEGALLNYAGNAGNNRQPLVNGWIECEKTLKAGPKNIQEFGNALSQALKGKELPDSYQPKLDEPCVFPDKILPNLHKSCSTNSKL